MARRRCASSSSIRFFNCLGWGHHHALGFAEAYKDVIHEDAIKVGGRHKAPDYCFGSAGRASSFSKPSGRPSSEERSHPRISTAAVRVLGRCPSRCRCRSSPISRIRRLDCRVKPALTDKASWAEFATSRSPLRRAVDSIAARSQGCRLQRFPSTSTQKRPTQAGHGHARTAFLKKLKAAESFWPGNRPAQRPQPARAHFAVSHDRSHPVLGACVRTAASSCTASSARYRMARRCTADSRSCSQGRPGATIRRHSISTRSTTAEPPDALTPTLVSDDKAAQGHLQHLYYPTPYEFSLLPVESLGQVYEQFLGKVIR